VSRRRRIRGPRDLATLHARSQEAFLNAAEALSEARREQRTIAEQVASMRARGIRVSRYSVRHYFAHDLERGPGGWSVPKKADRSYHGDLWIVSTEGVVERPVRGSRARTLVSEHANAVQRYLTKQDPEGDGLRHFVGRRVAGVELEIDPDRLDGLQRQGDFDDFLDIYVDRGG
jgi:hypothetical protein